MDGTTLYRLPVLADSLGLSNVGHRSLVDPRGHRSADIDTHEVWERDRTWSVEGTAAFDGGGEMIVQRPLWCDEAA